MSFKKTYFVYILTNKYNTVFYVGVTGNLSRRLTSHKGKFVQSFTKKYNVNKLVYYERYDDIRYAIEREKKLKKWKRQWKIDLILQNNPSFDELNDYF